MSVVDFRAVFGVLILTPHAVNPSVRSTDTWKFGELRSVMRYSVKLSLCAPSAGA